MKRASYGWVVGAVVALSGAGSAGCAASGQGDRGVDIPRSITVVGHGQARAEPDIATVTLGVEARAATVDEAMRDANARLERVRAALTQGGVDTKDLQTANFNVRFERFPMHDHPPGYPIPRPLPAPDAPPVPEPEPPPAPEGAPAGAPPGSAPSPATMQLTKPPPGAGVYVVDNQLHVTVRDLDRLGALLGEAIAAGANDVWGVQFELDEDDALLAAARADAMRDARERGAQLAELAGVRLGPVLAVRESGARGPVPPPSPMPMMYDASAARSGGAVPIEGGEVEATQAIEVIYGLPGDE